MQEVINMEAGNLSRICKPARCKKAVKVGFFRKLLVKIIKIGQISKINKLAKFNKTVQVGNL